MKLLLSRHGNTFGPGDKVVWTGTRNDLPLVEAGFEQARELGRALKEHVISPAAVYVSELQRVYNYATTAIAEAGLKLEPVVDKRLLEIDYGSWTGLSNEQVKDKFNAAELDAWNQSSSWPESSDWGPGEAVITQNVVDFSKEVLEKHANETVLVISSNGTLRYFLKLKDGLFEQQVEQGNFKVKTGNTCLMTFEKSWAMQFWNRSPKDWGS